MAFIGDVALLGPGRTITASTTAVRNATALPPGKYVFENNGSPVFLRCGGSTVAAVTTDMRLPDEGVFTITIPDSGYGYVSFITASGSSTVYCAGSDEATAASQPPAWS